MVEARTPPACGISICWIPDNGPSPSPHDDWGNSKESNDAGGVDKGASGTCKVTAGAAVVATGTAEAMAGADRLMAGLEVAGAGRIAAGAVDVTAGAVVRARSGAVTGTDTAAKAGERDSG